MLNAKLVFDGALSLHVDAAVVHAVNIYTGVSVLLLSFTTR